MQPITVKMAAVVRKVWRYCSSFAAAITPLLLLGMSIFLFACTPQVVQVLETVVVTELVPGPERVVTQDVVREVMVTPTPPSLPVEPKVLVVCLAQEPASLYSLGEASFARDAVLEALYDFGVDTLDYAYQPVGIVKLPSLADGDARLLEVTVKVGDQVYDAALDEVVTIAPTRTVTLVQTEGAPILVDFSQVTEAQTIQLRASWTLADGLTWQDGAPVTTADILFAWQVGAAAETPTSKYLYERTAAFTASDGKTWTWVGLPGYSSATFAADGVFTPLPSHLYGADGSRPLTPAEMLQDEQVNRSPLAFGPFRLVEWQAGQWITLEKNPTYFRSAEGLPHLDKIVFRFVPDPNQLAAQLISGECDLGTQDAAYDSALPLFRQLADQDLLVLQSAPGTAFEHIDFNAQPLATYRGFAGVAKNQDGTWLFDQPEVRQAIAYCLDRQALVDQALDGAAVLLNSYLPPSHPLYAGDDALALYAFDPLQGKALLAKNGWLDSDGDGWLDQDGRRFSVVLSTRRSTLREKIAPLIAEQLSAHCGIEVQVQAYGAEYFDSGPAGVLFGRQYDLGEFSWRMTSLEPPCDLYRSSRIPQSGQWGDLNMAGFRSAAFDAACIQAVTALDGASRQAFHKLAQQIYAAELPSLPLFARDRLLVHRPEILGVILDATARSEMWNVENFDK